MSRIRLCVYVVATALGLSTCASAVNAVILFQDDFQSDTPTLTNGGGDANPVIGAGDIGGNWITVESGPTYLQVLNDDPIGSDLAGANHYVSMVRWNNIDSSNSKLFATGWTAADTLDKVVQLDLSIYQTAPWEGSATADLGIQLADKAPNASITASNVGPWVDVTPAMTGSLDAWHTIRIVANMSGTLNQSGLAPQTYTITVDGGTPSAPIGFVESINQVQFFSFYGGANGHTDYIDNVTFQIVPEPYSIILGPIGAVGVGLAAARRRKKIAS